MRVSCLRLASIWGIFGRAFQETTSPHPAALSAISSPLGAAVSTRTVNNRPWPNRRIVSLAFCLEIYIISTSVYSDRRVASFHVKPVLAVPGDMFTTHVCTSNILAYNESI